MGGGSGSNRPSNTSAGSSTTTAGSPVTGCPLGTGNLSVVVVYQYGSERPPLDQAQVDISGPGGNSTQRTGTSGSVVFSNLQPGSYSIRVTHANTTEGSASANVTADATVRADVVVNPLGTLQGQVIDANNTDANTNKIEGASVNIVGRAGCTTTTNAQGVFQFTRMESGTYRLEASKTNYTTNTVNVEARFRPGETVNTSDIPLSRQIRVTPNQSTFTVVLDRSGNAPAAYPILEFQISNGPPNHLFDVQVARGSNTGLSGGPGLSGAWSSSSSVRTRQSQTVFSSWSNGEQSLRLDASGAANYRMPLEWWRDLARIPLSSFSSAISIYYRVISFASAASQPSAYSTGTTAGSSAPSVQVQNNLVSFQVVDLGYTNGGIAKSIRMEFTVREANTTNMYTIVQWMQGSMRRWRGAGSSPTYPTHQLYNITHDANFPDRTIDRLRTDPRYADGVHTISADGRTASATDAPNQGNIVAPYTHFYDNIDFETRVHLNYDVPAAVNITRQDGSPPVYGVITGNMSPDPITLASQTWQTRVLQELTSSGTNITHPNTFAGP